MTRTATNPDTPGAPRSAPGGGRAEARARERARVALERNGNPQLAVAAKVHPDWITAAGVGLGVAGGAAAATRHWRTAATLWGLCCAADVIDGTVARARAAETGEENPLGAVTDSVADRICDAAIALGIAAGQHAQGNTYAAAAAAAAAAISPIPAHVSAKAAAAGYDAPRHAPGRLERSIAYAVALTLPRTAGAISTGIAAASLVSAGRRWASLYAQR